MAGDKTAEDPPQIVDSWWEIRCRTKSRGDPTSSTLEKFEHKMVNSRSILIHVGLVCGNPQFGPKSVETRPSLLKDHW